MQTESQNLDHLTIEELINIIDRHYEEFRARVAGSSPLHLGLISTEEAAKLLDVSDATVRAMIHRKELGAFRVNPLRFRIPRVAVLAHLARIYSPAELIPPRSTEGRPCDPPPQSVHDSLAE